jgi:coproporphyrinogen III oxidase-like Fe-S oxidoreductase
MLVHTDLANRMSHPQRHRLLQGYPMAPVLQDWNERRDPLGDLPVDPRRGLLVGVLPHTFCNPRVRGCGFCTFPHESFSNERARSVAARVVKEVKASALRGREVHALYFGGGTANLTPVDALRSLADAVTSTFDIARAEVTLEGVATYFLAREEAMLEMLGAIPAASSRISVGVQSFDPAWIARMGRQAFGDEASFTAVVASAHARGMTTSCDLLFNLPGQTTKEALADVARADACGFDQICIYNLVLDARLDTPWAHERSLLVKRPSLEGACATWIALREDLLARGFVQTTLTNFERAPRFAYERASFDPARFDAVGFGPGAISTFTDVRTLGAKKWINAGKSDDYSAAMDSTGRAAARAFDYTTLDLRLLHVTRNLSALGIDRASYRQFFGRDVVDDFPQEVEALVAEALVAVDDARLALTPRGMFYADSVAGLFASRRAAALRKSNDAMIHAMG